MTAIASSWRKAGGPALAVAVGAIFAAFAVGRFLIDPARERLVIAGVAVILVLAVTFVRPRALLFLLISWLSVIGLVRRLLDTVTPIGRLDPLLAIEPVALILLLFVASERGAFTRLTRLSKIVLWINALIAVEALNPAQGSISVGLFGLNFLLVPMLAFWVARGLCDDGSMRKLLLLVGAISIPTALYGLYQTFRGFPSWDQAYITANYATLVPVNGVSRPFSSFTSPAEFATFLAVGAVVWLGFGLRRGASPLALAAVALILAGMLYESSRGIVFCLAAAIGLMIAAWWRVPLIVAAAFVVGMVIAVPTIAKLATPAQSPSSSSVLISHQVTGLENPTNSNTSDLFLKWDQLKTALESVKAHPIGFGPGAISLAGAKLGGQVVGAEADPGNMSVGFGLPGLFLYVLLVASVFPLLYRLARDRRDRLGLVALGVVTVMVLQWFNGAQYSTALLPWLILGWADRQNADLVSPLG